MNTSAIKLTFEEQNNAERFVVVMPHFILLKMTDVRKDNDLDRKNLKDRLYCIRDTVKRHLFGLS